MKGSSARRRARERIASARNIARPCRNAPVNSVDGVARDDDASAGGDSKREKERRENQSAVSAILGARPGGPRALLFASVSPCVCVRAHTYIMCVCVCASYPTARTLRKLTFSRLTRARERASERASIRFQLESQRNVWRAREAQRR